MANWNNLTKGFFKENPVFVLLLGCCPTLATTTSAINGLSACTGCDDASQLQNCMCGRRADEGRQGVFALFGQEVCIGWRQVSVLSRKSGRDIAACNQYCDIQKTVA